MKNEAEVLQKIDEEIFQNAKIVSIGGTPFVSLGDVRRILRETILSEQPKEPTYEQLKYAYDLQHDIIETLEKSNQDLSDRVVKAEGLMSECQIIQANQKTIPFCILPEGTYIRIDLAHQAKTKGDVIRESNESLAEFIHNRVDCRACIANRTSCSMCSMVDCCETWIDYLNQPVESEE